MVPKMDLKEINAKIVFWLHLPIVIILFGMFVIPKSLWAGKVIFHFWYFVSIIFFQFLWSLFIYRKFDIICPLTTLMQWLRGYPLKSKQNYDHSFIAETLDKFRIKIHYKGVNIALIVTLILVVVQYFWFR